MKHEKSCGCIIIEDKKVLLIKQTNGIWGFPKGHVEENETELQTASKEVVLFLAKKIGGNLSRQESEISQIEWLCFDDAISRLSYKNTKDLFKKVVSQL